MIGQPETPDEVAAAVRDAGDPVAVWGGGTKARLIGTGESLETKRLSGIVEYESSEYTITAMAGTPVRELEEALREKGQYLPFDPLTLGDASTIGGSVAAGTSGPGRFRYGGLRDFLIGIQFVDGHGTLARSGGKVVKNAAGFDFPKFMVGSLGRFGVLTEVSFKVFPAPVATRLIQVHCETCEVGVERMAHVASSRWEAQELEYDAESGKLGIRLGGPEEALEALLREIEETWPGETERLPDDMEEVAVIWARSLFVLGESREVIVKVALSPSRIVEFEKRVEGLGNGMRWYSSGGAVAYLSPEPDQLGELDRILQDLKLEGLVIRGPLDGSPRLGDRRSASIIQRVKEAFDPAGRFPAF